MSVVVTRARTRAPRMDLESFARAAGIHPELARRFVALGLIEATRDNRGALLFAPAQVARVARIQRLRAGFSMNYAAVGLVMDLLDRITVLEAELRKRPTTRGGSPWTSTV
jgi:chaperone modulatory protein CbpM